MWEGLLSLPTGVNDEQIPGDLLHPVPTPSSQLHSQAGNSKLGGKWSLSVLESNSPSAHSAG